MRLYDTFSNESFTETIDTEAAVSNLSRLALAKGLIVRSSGGHLLPNSPVDPSESLPEYKDWPSNLKLLYGDVTAYSNWGRPEPQAGEGPWRAMFIQEWGALHTNDERPHRQSLRDFLENALSAMHLYTEVYAQSLDSGRTERPYPRLLLRSISHPPIVQFRESPGAELVTLIPGTPRWARAGRIVKRLADVEFNDNDFSHPNDSPFDI